MKYITLLCFLFVGMLIGIQPANAIDMEFNGWAWSSVSGWIKLNNEPADGGPDYGVIASGSSSPYTVSGYTWSSTNLPGTPSTGLGWIKFGNPTNDNPDLGGTRPECGGAANDPKLVSDGTGYKLTGAAQIISLAPAVGPWASNSSNGNWNGCILLDKASMANLPGSPSSAANFGIRFVPNSAVPGQYKAEVNSSTGSPNAWSAGAASGSSNCALAGLCFGGTAWIAFTNVTINVPVDPPITVNLQVTNWSSNCQTASNPLTVSWSTTGSVTSCSLSSNDGTVNETGLSPNGTLSVSIPPTDGTTFTMTCNGVEATTGASITGTDTDLVQCSQCSDQENNDVTPIPAIYNSVSQNGAVDANDVSCHKNCVIAANGSSYNSAFDNESYDCKTPNTPGTGTRKLPIPIEN